MAKSANLLVDGLGGPARVGLLLPLHWQTVVLVLAGVATAATVVVGRSPDDLAGCDVACTDVGSAQAVLDAGVEDVLAVSLHPLGAPLPAVPPPVLDHAREVPGYGDSWSGPAPAEVRVEVRGRRLGPLPSLPVGPADRVLVTGSPADPEALAVLLGCLAAGAALVLVPAPASVDLPAVAAGEQVTATAGLELPGLRRLG